MVFGDVKDVVRTTLGKRDIEPVIMDYIVSSGRREIEKVNNWYYMRRVVGLNLVAGTQSYSIAAGGAIPEANFKDSRQFMYRTPTGNFFNEVPSGDRNQLDLIYTTDGRGAPQRYCIDDESGTMNLLIYPVSPDQAYVTRLLYYAWTSNPTSDTGTDELVSRWPELLIYSAVGQGFRIITKENELAKPWDEKMAAELAKLKNYDWFRRESEKNMLHPARGPFMAGSGGTSLNRKIYW